jgi:hypothetical protein
VLDNRLGHAKLCISPFDTALSGDKRGEKRSLKIWEPSTQGAGRCAPCEPHIEVTEKTLVNCLGARQGLQEQIFKPKGLILAQNERWRRGLGMQVEREKVRKDLSKAA